MADTFQVPTESAFRIPCVVPAEPGWRVAVLNFGVVELVPIVAWKLAPTLVGDGFMSSSTVLACQPIPEQHYAEARIVGRPLDPDMSQSDVVRHLATTRKIFENL